MNQNMIKAAIIFAEADKSNLKNFEKDATGVYAVANNRLKDTQRWGYESFEDVITDASQFSGFGSPEFQKAMSGQLSEEEQKYYKKAMQIVKGYDSGLIKDPTGGADHYYNPDLASPDWGGLTDEKKVKVGDAYYPETYRTAHSYRKETRRLSARQKNVQNVQKLLNKRGFELAEDGLMGENTSEAIKDFQAANNLKIDGIAGKKTLAALTSE